MNEINTIGHFGYISELDPEHHRARVFFPDLGITSSFLPIGVPNTKDNHDEHLLDIGEHVYTLMHENTGIILCSIYDNKNVPPVANENIRSVIFKDGTRLSYDRENNVFNYSDYNGNTITMDSSGINISSQGNINITASGNVKISGARIDLN